ncbi:uncharacterized protein G2W53_034554 [Senna tora]|uniref:Uncharacterized protein n=1 Tax=Senna tora TaxID=362788 RepID=A0A834SZI3_9FABA|nr:uncharacterized protein G2W53_034554 [Senna tora]
MPQITRLTRPVQIRRTGSKYLLLKAPNYRVQTLHRRLALHHIIGIVKDVQQVVVNLRVNPSGIARVNLRVDTRELGLRQVLIKLARVIPVADSLPPVGFCFGGVLVISVGGEEWSLCHWRSGHPLVERY